MHMCPCPPWALDASGGKAAVRLCSLHRLPSRRPLSLASRAVVAFSGVMLCWESGPLRAGEAWNHAWAINTVPDDARLKALRPDAAESCQRSARSHFWAHPPGTCGNAPSVQQREPSSAWPGWPCLRFADQPNAGCFGAPELGEAPDTNCRRLAIVVPLCLLLLFVLCVVSVAWRTDPPSLRWGEF